MRVLLTFKHEGRSYRAGDSISLPTELATAFAAQGLVADDAPVVTVTPAAVKAKSGELSAAQTMVDTNTDRVDLEYPIDEDDDAAEDIEDAESEVAPPKKRRIRHK